MYYSYYINGQEYKIDLDERFSPEENKALCGDDVYTVEEIYENIEDFINSMIKEKNISREEVEKEINKNIEEYEFTQDYSDYAIFFKEYVYFKTGRVAKVIFY